MTEKLSDVLDGEGTNLVYISGKLDGKQIDFDGPIEWTRKFDRPTYPIVPALPQYDPSVFKNPVFDYESSHWIEKDADAQAEQIAKLKQENDELKKEKPSFKMRLKIFDKVKLIPQLFLVSFYQLFSNYLNLLQAFKRKKEPTNV